MITQFQPQTQPRYRTDVVYHDRTSKASYVASKYAPILGGSVLDVGCDAAALRRLVGKPGEYVGIDIRPDADLVVDLDRDNLPVGDRSFDTVVCTDVLEHLERCHAGVDELCRVSRERVIVSLPNPLRALMLAIVEGKAGRAKFYGLPVERPADRHRWFFGYEEAVEFVTVRGQRQGFEVEQVDAEHHGCPKWERGGREPARVAERDGGDDVVRVAAIRNFEPSPQRHRGTEEGGMPGFNAPASCLPLRTLRLCGESSDLKSDGR